MMRPWRHAHVQHAHEDARRREHDPVRPVRQRSARDSCAAVHLHARASNQGRRARSQPRCQAGAVRSAKVHAPTKASVTRHEQHDRYHSEIEPAVMAAGWLLEDHGEHGREGQCQSEHVNMAILVEDCRMHGLVLLRISGSYAQLVKARTDVPSMVQCCVTLSRQGGGAIQSQLIGRELIGWLAGHMLLVVVDCSRPWAEGGGEWRAFEPMLAPRLSAGSRRSFLPNFVLFHSARW